MSPKRSFPNTILVYTGPFTNSRLVVENVIAPKTANAATKMPTKIMRRVFNDVFTIKKVLLSLVQLRYGGLGRVLTGSKSFQMLLQSMPRTL